MKLNIGSRAVGITTMIRMDHTHVLMLFRRYHHDTPVSRKQALVANACLALEIHAQLEEEIFYPALREVIGRNDVLDNAVPEHDELREFIAALRAMEPDDRRFDQTFRELMRAVLHHIADEETTLLPQAEEQLAGDLVRLGMAMTRRRIQLLGPHAGEVTVTAARSFPLLTAAAAVGAVAVGWMIASSHSTRH